MSIALWISSFILAKQKPHTVPIVARRICTMLGPMKNELKQRECMVIRKHVVRPTDTARLEEIDNTGAEEKTDTDKIWQPCLEF